MDSHGQNKKDKPLLQATQDGNCVGNRWLTDINLLEAAFKRCILFDHLSVLIGRRGTDAPKLASGQRRLRERVRK